MSSTTITMYVLSRRTRAVHCATTQNKWIICHFMACNLKLVHRSSLFERDGWINQHTNKGSEKGYNSNGEIEWAQCDSYTFYQFVVRWATVRLTRTKFFQSNITSVAFELNGCVLSNVCSEYIFLLNYFTWFKILNSRYFENTTRTLSFQLSTRALNKNVVHSQINSIDVIQIFG